MRRTRLGFTLVEIVVVTAVLAILLVALSFLLGPSVRAKGIESRIKSDLRQLSIAVRLYQDQNDDRHPNDWYALKNPPPLCYPNWPKQSVYSKEGSWSIYGYGCYNLNYGHTQELMEERGAGRFKYPYDPAKDALADATFYQIDWDRKINMEFFSGPGQVIGTRVVPMSRVLGIRHDGSAYWKDYLEPWERERIGCLSLVLPSATH